MDLKCVSWTDLLPFQNLFRELESKLLKSVLPGRALFCEFAFHFKVKSSLYSRKLGEPFSFTASQLVFCPFYLNRTWLYKKTQHLLQDRAVYLCDSFLRISYNQLWQALNPAHCHNNDPSIMFFKYQLKPRQYWAVSADRDQSFV